MDEFTFRFFKAQEQGMMARVETSGSNVGLNVFAEAESDFDLTNGELCAIQVIGVGSDISFYATEKEFSEKNGNFSTTSLIPIGTFSPDDKESCHIWFSGILQDCSFLPNTPKEIPNAQLIVKTLDMTLTVATALDKPPEPHGIVSGVVWIYGNVKRKA